MEKFSQFMDQLCRLNGKKNQIDTFLKMLSSRKYTMGVDNFDLLNLEDILTIPEINFLIITAFNMKNLLLLSHLLALANPEILDTTVRQQLLIHNAIKINAVISRVDDSKELCDNFEERLTLSSQNGSYLLVEQQGQLIGLFKFTGRITFLPLKTLVLNNGIAIPQCAYSLSQVTKNYLITEFGDETRTTWFSNTPIISVALNRLVRFTSNQWQQFESEIERRPLQPPLWFGYQTGFTKRRNLANRPNYLLQQEVD